MTERKKWVRTGPIVGRRTCSKCGETIKFRNKVSYGFSIRRKPKIRCNRCIGSLPKRRLQLTSI